MGASEAYAALGPALRRLAAADADVVRTQIAVSEIAAPTGEEARRGQWMAGRFADLGLQDVRIDRAGNVIGRRPGAEGRPAVAICAHLDTVFPRGTSIAVRRDGPRLIGPGIVDNGRGLASILALAETIDGASVRTQAPLAFVATAGEEGIGNLAGAKAFFADAGHAIAAAVVIDGAGDERVVHRGLGSRRYRIVFRGPGGHSWAAHGIANPIHAAAGAVARLADLSLPTHPRTTLTVGRIGGGIAVNAIPEDAWFEIDLRSTSAGALARCEQELRASVAAATAAANASRAAGTPPLTDDVALIGDRPCGELPVDHPLVTAAIDATRLIGREPDLATASTDANIPLSLGIPAIAVGGGGRGGGAHTLAEWYDNTDGALGLARALTIVVAAAGLAAGPAAPAATR